MAKAKEAGLKGEALSVQLGLLTGPSLRDKNQVVVVPEGVLKKEELKPADRSAEITALGTAADALTEALPSTGLDEIGRHALQEVIHKLDQTDGGQALDEIAPSFARRVVHHGYMRQWYHTPEGERLVSAAEKAIDAVDADETTSSFSGTGTKSKELRDAFGTRAWVFSTPKKVSYAYIERKPEYIGGGMPALLVAVDLPAGADPVTDAPKATAARIYDVNSNLLASWSKEKGFVCDLSHWREVVAPGGNNLAKECIPPHILIMSLDGDVYGLAAEKGLVHPVADQSKAAADTFLDEAAKLLPDNAHLDLVGEYLWAYVYPSPDAKHPTLMGNKQMKSNVQQTVYQSCGNVAGGMMHGDCADIAEVYQVLTTRQGLNPIIIGLPEHAACCWSVKESDLWHVSLLQTGPPLEFFDKVLPDALGKCYRSFDPSMPFDSNELPLLLRFSGESSRSEWVLSWRIFSEPKYCHTMIEVERDWQYETYQTGIATMQAMIKGGDDDNANYRELCGLYDFTGQYDLSAEYCRKARDRTDSPMSKLTLSIQLAQHLLEGGKRDEAQATIEDVLTKQLPPLREKLGASELNIANNIVSVCLNLEGGPSLRAFALKTMQQELTPKLSQYIDRLGQYLASPQFNKDMWDSSPELRSLRGICSGYVGLDIELLKQMGKEADTGASAQQVKASIESYLQHVSFYDVEEESSAIGRYELNGRWYELAMGQAAFDKLLDAASVPTSTKVDHTKRSSGPDQITRDLPWINASVPYWFSRTVELFRKDVAKLDPEAVARCTKHLAAADQATIALGLQNPGYKMLAILGEVIAALAAHDGPGLAKVLKKIAEDNDKALRDDAAQWLGDSARFMDLAWYKQVLAAWRDEVDYKPKYFWIAWRAAICKAPEQALDGGEDGRRALQGLPGIRAGIRLHEVDARSGQARGWALSRRLAEEAPR